jgi:hypothetical protein
MKRNFLSIMALSGFGLSAQGAIPITSYETTAVEIPSEYAVQGGFWGISAGVNYIGANDMGMALIPNTTMPDLVVDLPDLTINSKQGYDILLTSGYRIYRWRFEAELGYRFNKAETITNFTYGPPIATLSDDIAASGSTKAITLMGNVMYDRYFTTGWMWMLGLGIGGAVIDMDVSVDANSVPAHGNSQLQFNKRKIVPAVQGIVGIGYAWNDHIETAVTYRYIYPFNNKFWVEGKFIENATIQFNPQYHANVINFEIRFT